VGGSGRVIVGESVKEGSRRPSRAHPSPFLSLRFASGWPTTLEPPSILIGEGLDLLPLRRFPIRLGNSVRSHFFLFSNSNSPRVELKAHRRVSLSLSLQIYRTRTLRIPHRLQHAPRQNPRSTHPESLARSSRGMDDADTDSVSLDLLRAPFSSSLALPPSFHSNINSLTQPQPNSPPPFFLSLFPHIASPPASA